jgi:gamma-glutamyltranspeptidase / glutathione hydrolase
MASTFGTPAYGSEGVIATPHYLASLAGIDVLRDGGSAVDAAIAANLVLAVVWPQQCGPGGDLFAQVATADGIFGLNASGRAGEAMTVDAYRARGLEAMPARGPLSVTVPGAVDGWFSLHERFGKLDMARLVAPAIQRARNGFHVTSFVSEATRSSGSPERPVATGEQLLQPDLAASLEMLAREGRGAMYGGSLGERICEYVASQGSLLCASDFASHVSEWVEPLRVEYRGTEVLELPPNSHGITLLRMLESLYADSVGNWDTAERVHQMVQRKKDAFAYRDANVGDPARGDTIYLCAADRDGMIVSLIQSLYSAWGSGVRVPGTGITLHNRGWGFHSRLADAHPNALRPGKRPLHTLMPGLVLRDSQPWLAFGTRGADGQPQTGLQLITALLDLGMSLQEAMEAPRWIHDAPGERFARNTLVLESRFGQSVSDDLTSRGHDVITTGPLDMIMGTAQMIQVDEEHGCHVASTDPRGDGVALAL